MLPLDLHKFKQILEWPLASLYQTCHLYLIADILLLDGIPLFTLKYI